MYNIKFSSTLGTVRTYTDPRRAQASTSAATRETYAVWHAVSSVRRVDATRVPRPSIRGCKQSKQANKAMGACGAKPACCGGPKSGTGQSGGGSEIDAGAATFACDTGIESFDEFFSKAQETLMGVMETNNDICHASEAIVAAACAISGAPKVELNVGASGHGSPYVIFKTTVDGELWKEHGPETRTVKDAKERGYITNGNDPYTLTSEEKRKEVEAVAAKLPAVLKGYDMLMKKKADLEACWGKNAPKGVKVAVKQGYYYVATKSARTAAGEDKAAKKKNVEDANKFFGQSAALLMRHSCSLLACCSVF